MIRELWLDWDNNCHNTSKKWMEIHNLVMGKNYINSKQPKWEDVHQYDFKDVLPNLTLQLKNFIFDSELMFENPYFYDDIVEIVNEICKYTKVHIVSICSDKSVEKKRKLIKKYMPDVHFQPILYTEYYDKSHINMYNGVFSDDVARNLSTSNAWFKICFQYLGIKMDINENWDGCIVTRWRKDIEGVQLKNLLGIEV